MNAPIVHIGYHKTGTSWFQKAFYPHVRNAEYLNRRKVKSAFLNTTAFTFDPEQARRLLEGSGRPIVCEEELVGGFENDGLLGALSKDMAYRINSVYPDAQIVVFIRNQVDMLRSTYLQYVREGGTRSLPRFLFPYQHAEPLLRRNWTRRPMLTLDRFAYQHLIRHYREVFGPESVHVFCYEAFAEDPRGFAEDFARRFDLDVPLDRLRYTSCNPALGRFSVQLARALGPFSRTNAVNRLRILPVLPKWLHKKGIAWLNATPLGGPRVTNRTLFGDRLYRELHDRFVPDNRALAAELDLPLERYGYPMAPLEETSAGAKDEGKVRPPERPA